VTVGDYTWDRSSILLSVGPPGPQQIRLRGGRNRDLMKKALQEPKDRTEKLLGGALEPWNLD